MTTEALQTERPLSDVAPDLPIRITMRTFPVPNPVPGAKQVLRQDETVEFRVTTPNWKQEMIEMPCTTMGDSPQGLILKQCVQMYDDLRRRFADVLAERDALKTICDEIGNPGGGGKKKGK